MKKISTHALTLALLFCLTLISCKKEDSTTGGNLINDLPVDACRPTQLNISGPKNKLCKFVYDSQKRLIEVNDESKLTKFTYNQQGYLVTFEIYKDDTLNQYKEFSYLNGKLATEKSYFVDKGTKKYVSEIGRYEYINQRLSKKNLYGVNPTDTIERYVSYIDYLVDNNNNITSETYYFSHNYVGFTKNHTVTYTYSDYPATKGLNYILFINFDLMENKFLPKTIAKQFETEGSSQSFSFLNKNEKGYPTLFTGITNMGTLNFDLTYNCN